MARQETWFPGPQRSSSGRLGNVPQALIQINAMNAPGEIRHDKRHEIGTDFDLTADVVGVAEGQQNFVRALTN